LPLTAPIAEGAATARGVSSFGGGGQAYSLRRSFASEGSRPFASGTGRGGGVVVLGMGRKFPVHFDPQN